MDLNIHHTGVAVRDLAAVAEKYIAYFGYRKRTGIIHDPIQEHTCNFYTCPEIVATWKWCNPTAPKLS